MKLHTLALLAGAAFALTACDQLPGGHKAEKKDDHAAAAPAEAKKDEKAAKKDEHSAAATAEAKKEEPKKEEHSAAPAEAKKDEKAATPAAMSSTEGQGSGSQEQTKA